MKKLLVTGASGMLGSNIVLELKERYDIFGLYRSSLNPAVKKGFKIDLVDKDRVMALISEINPDFIIHCAELTDVDKCERDYSLAHRINAVATKNLAASIASRVRFIYVSTDSVFDGKKGNYNEDDRPCPLNNYAKSKLEGEDFVRQEADNFAIVRTNIFGWNHVKGESFAEWIFTSLRQKRRIKMFTDVIFSPITVNTLSVLIDTLLGMDFVGLLNIESSTSISKYDFGLSLAKLFNLDASLITPVSVDSFGFKAKRPKNTSLNVSKANAIFGTLPTAEEELLKFYNTRPVKGEQNHEPFYSNRKT